MRTIVDYVEHWAGVQPDKCLYNFMDQDGKEKESYTFLAFNERTRHLAAHLAGLNGLVKGDRVMLVYPPGLELLVAFFACARIGMIPVPIYPPTPMSFDVGIAKLAFISDDCGARTALTTRSFYRSYQMLLAKQRFSSLWLSSSILPQLEWITTDDVRGVAPDSFTNDTGEILFLQYTSGSTSDPKGVIVTHENVIHNCNSTLDHVPVGVSWLPQYHDMGLIGYYLFPPISGGTTYGFSPLTFLKRPDLWLQTISRVRATCTSSPNFGYEYCLRDDKLPLDKIAGVDLSSLRVMMNAAEPVRAETFTRFFERFAPFGLRSESYVVAYGLAENTLAVTLHGRQILTVNKTQIQHRSLHIENGQPQNNNQLCIVSCGMPLEGVKVRIVDPESGAALLEERIGEIWIAGPSRGRGYWNRLELSSAVFGGKVTNDAADNNTYLRTGDLGFYYEGEVFVCGRIKDLIIIHGVNYYPQDIEIIVESSSSKIRKGGVAAFDMDEGGETLVVVAEVKRADKMPDPLEIARALRTQYYVEPQTLVFVPHGAIAKTTSGKIARRRTRERWLSGEMPVIVSHTFANRMEPSGELTGPRGRFQYLVDFYNITGREEYSFAEIGIDSLTMVQLLEDIKALLEENGAGDIVSEVDVRLLQRLTVAEFFSMLDQFEKTPGKFLLPLRLLLKRIQHEQEIYERECMRSDAELKLGHVKITPSQEPMANVLLTGATGFFGPFLLNSLLRKTPYTYYLLIRATDPAHGLDRVRAGLRRSRLWTPDLDAQLGQRVRVICGDLSQHNLGLRSEQWQELTSQVQAVCHNAALVNYLLNYDSLRPHNVDGTRELLRFAFTGTAKEFHLISSTFIFGWTAKGRLLETDNNEDMGNLDFGYAQSKWVAEHLAFAAEREGLKVRVYRPSLISASTNGVGGRDDIAIRLLVFMIKHGIAINARNQISFLPADIASDNIAAIFMQRQTDATTFHVTVDDYYNMMDVTRIITREFGYPFTYYDIPAFVDRMNQLCTRDDLLYPLLDFFNRSYHKIAAMQQKRYCNDAYQLARRASGSSRQDPELVDTVTSIVNFMLEEGLIPGRIKPGVAATVLFPSMISSPEMQYPG